MENIYQDKWTKLIEADKDAFILDVRTPQECAQGILSNAVILNFMHSESFIAGLEKLDKHKSYYVYCRSGNRSAKACMIMDQMGFSKTYNLLGGILEWKGILEH
ncbi:MAG: rhodanese-like domain-containing protein [Flavobacteriales bacterium]